MKNKIIPVFVYMFVIGIVLLSVGPAFAQVIIPGQTPAPFINQQGPSSVSGWVQVVLTVIKWFYSIIFIIAVFFILMAAFHFVTSKGDPAKTKTARSELMYAVVGIAVALLSYGIVAFIGNTVNTATNTQGTSF